MDTMNLIIPQIYLGGLNAAKNSEFLKKVGICSILTIDINPLHPQYTDNFKYKFIKALDSPTQNLFCFFDECYEFIEDTCNNGQAIIVHCYVGVSRSSTIVLAYLMRKYGLSLKESLLKVSAKRFVSPNSGFMDQLRLYESLGCCIDATDPSYRAYKLNQFAKNMIETFSNFTKDDIPLSMLAKDPSLNLENHQHSLTNGSIDTFKYSCIYKCKNCRRDLFYAHSLLTHSQGLGYLAYRDRIYGKWRRETKLATPPIDPIPSSGLMTDQSKSSPALLSRDQADDAICRDFIFIEPVAWMRDNITAIQGKLNCPKCNSKLGSFNWAGEKCGCQTWITPAFNIQKSKVDLYDPRLTSLPVAAKCET